MNVGIIQYDVSKDVMINIEKIKELTKNISGELFVLPELCDYGYLFDSKDELLKIAPPISENKMVKFLCELSQEKSCTIVGGVLEKVSYDIYNSAILVSNGEVKGVYRKIHLSDFEKQFFTSGKENKIFEVNNIKIGIQICFDLWFPEMSREQFFKGADLICALGNFGGETTFEIAKIRALENLTPVIICNRVGQEKNDSMNASFLGRSSIIESNGNRSFYGIDHEEICVVKSIELEKKKGNVICKDFSLEINKHFYR